MPDLTSVPAWGIFAIAVLWLVFQFLDKWQKRQIEAAAKKRKTSLPPPPSKREDTGPRPITADEVAAVIRDQQERREILDLLRETNSAITSHTETDNEMLEVLKRQSAALDRQSGALDKVAEGYQRLSHAEEQQTEILRALHREQARTSNNVAKLVKSTSYPRLEAVEPKD